MIFNQYSDLAYGGGAGADLRVINVTPQTIRVCLCGHPYTPNLSGVRGRMATGEMETFKTSMKGAQALRLKTNTPAVSMDQISQNFATAKDTTDLDSKINVLAGKVYEQARELENVKFLASQKPEVVPGDTPVATAKAAKAAAAAAKASKAGETGEALL
jgi:hypothetical protein